MTTGFEVVDDYGRKQVLDTHPLLSFNHKLFSNSANLGDLYPDPRPIYAWLPDNNQIMTQNYFRSRRVALEDSKYYTTNRIQGFGTMYAFTSSKPTSDENYGLEVYDASGDIVFNSNQKPLKILDIINIPDVRQSRTTVSGRVTHWRKAYGSKTAAIVLVRQPLWASGSDFKTSGVALRDSYIALEETVEHRDGELADRWIGNTFALYALVIDVTNF